MLIDEVDGCPLWDFVAGDEIVPGAFVSDRLGIGTRCESWLASTAAWGDVVVKLLRPHQVSNPRGRAALTRERDALAIVNAPRIPRLLADLRATVRPALVLEHAIGEALDLLTEDAPLPLRRAAKIGCDVASALAAVRRVGLVHLDVKSSNVIVGDRSATLIDFGSARPIGFEPGEGVPLGSPGFAPPELEANATLTTAMDCYGLGTVLFEALTGEMPFDPDLEAAERPSPPVIEDVPEAIAALVHALLAPDPNARPDFDDVYMTLWPYISPSGSAISSSRALSGSKK